MIEESMKLQQLLHFVALYEEASVTKAAQRLNIVQPAISQQIAKLEDELGQLLFQRTAKGMVPTQVGEQAYRHFLPILESVRLAERELTRQPDQLKGRVSIGVIDSVANCGLSQTLIEFASEHPAVAIYLTGGYTMDLLEMLKSRKLDAAIIIKSESQNAFCVMDIIREPLAAVWSANSGLKLPKRLTLNSLSSYDLVIPSHRHGLRVRLEAAAEQVGARLNPKLEFDEFPAIDEFVQATDYVTILPRTVVQASLVRKRLLSRTITPRIPRSVVCAYDPSRPMSKAVEVFVSRLHQNMTAATRQFAS
jgi:LysR family transcriptional regulator, nitrogen assimilation regulatory protein